jgi:hypothetical protein
MDKRTLALLAALGATSPSFGGGNFVLVGKSFYSTTENRPR